MELEEANGHKHDYVNTLAWAVVLMGLVWFWITVFRFLGLLQ